MRQNPYGAAPAENPKGIRQAMSRVDPRERGLIGAAWYAGYLARAAAAGVDAVTLAATHRPVGHRLRPSSRQRSPGSTRREREGLSALPCHRRPCGALGDVLATTSSRRASGSGACCRRTKAASKLRLSNLTGAEQTVRISGAPGTGQALVLDETTFEAACRDPDWRSSAPRVAVSGEVLTLKPYAVAEIRFG